MAEKNTQDNQNSKKKHKWIGIFLIALLILFIGLAGYYLERDLEPMPDNQIEDSKVLDESADSSEEVAMNNGEESETTETEETPEIEEEIKEDTASNEGAVSSDMKTESEQPAADQRAEESAEVEQKQEVESDDSLVEDKDSESTSDTGEISIEESSEKKQEQAVSQEDDSSQLDSKVLDESADSSEEVAMNNGEESETTETEEITATEETPEIEEEIKEDTASNEGAVSSDMKTESEQLAADQRAEKSAEVEQKQEVESDDSLVEDKDSSMTADSDVEEDKVEKESDIKTESSSKNGGSDVIDESEIVEEKEEVIDTEPEKRKVSESDTEDSSLEKDELIVSSDQNQEADSETEELDKSDIDQESEDFVEDDSSQLDSGVDSEGQAESESQNDFSQELEDPTLLDRILSILGLSDSSFSQDLNILFVGLDDEESVAVGTIEADSIMLAKLRPEIDKLQLEHIDEDTNYKGQLLREYHNGDIQLAVEEITESEIDYYVYVNYQGFEKVIDELGGVQLTLEQEVKVPGLGLNLKAGDNLLSGKEALNFVRWRGSDSMARFERQKLLINSVVAKLKSNNILFNVKELYSTIVDSYNSIETDINPVLAAEIFKYIKDNDELELEFIE